MSGIDAFAYLFEEDAIRMALRDWPEGMNLAFCLEDSGDCEMIVYHKDEGRAVLRKVAAVLRRSPGQFAVTPEVPGHPTRKILFSEEQKMLAMLADADQLIEVATDYAINYRFAKDEGLDPATMTAPARSEPAAPPPAPTPGPNPEPAPARRAGSRLHLSEAGEKPARASAEGSGRASAGDEPPLRRSFLQRDPPKPEAPRPAAAKEPPVEPASRKKTVFLPVGYSPADAPERRECHFATGRIVGQNGRVRITLGEGKVGINTKTIHVSDVGFRDDFSRFVLPRFTLGEWREDKTVVLDVPQDLFPAAMAQRFRVQPCRAVVTVTAQGIFIAPGAPLAAEELKARRRLLTPARAAILAVLGIGLATGTMVKAWQPDLQRAGLMAEAEQPGAALQSLRAFMAR